MIDFDKSKYYYDEKTAEGFITIFEKYITHPKGPLSGKPFKLEEWQKDDIIRPLFGIKEKETGLRKHKVIYIQLPKKNGKTPLVAGIMLIVLMNLKHNGSRIASLASSRDQAKLIYRDACEMIRNSPYLSSKFKIYQGAIVCGRNSYIPLSADVSTNDGDGCEMVIVDELHRFKERELVDLMGSSQAAKAEPLFFMITTAGSDTTSICYEKYEKAKQVNSGIVKDDRYLGVVYEADPKDDPYIEATWKKANPNYGISVTKEFMAEADAEAKRNASTRNSFLRLHLNIWTKIRDLWIDDKDWSKGQPELDIERLKGQVCYGALDASATSDLMGFTLMFPPSAREYYPDKYLSFNWFWLPEDKGKDSADKNNINYVKWVEDGFIEETVGNTVDHDYVKDRILDIVEPFDLQILAFDPYNATQIVAKMGEVIGVDKIQKFRQGFVSMNEPCKTFEINVKRGNLLHGNNPVLRWCVSNTVLVTDTGGKLVKPDKNTKHQKIDGTVTNIMALWTSIISQPQQVGSWTDGMSEQEIKDFFAA